MASPSPSTSGREEHERDPILVVEPPNKLIKSPLSPKQYDVFINHRGPDVKTTLARQLYDSLQEAGIQAYLDSEETELGDSFSSTIKNAISSAKVHIAILSPRYAESPWCLAELAFMFQTKARIIPLFYHVKPSDLRYIKNEVALAFSKYKKQCRYPTQVIQQWKECLQNVSGIRGYEFHGGNENDKSLWNSILENIRRLLYDCMGIQLSSTESDQSKLCNVVAAVVSEKQKRKIPFPVAKYEVGLDELVNDFHSHCQRNGEMRDKIIGIYGMGGSGKTTLAKYLFNLKHSQFSASTILFDVRENHAKGELTSLQRKLIDKLFPGNHDNFCSIEEGIPVIEDNLQRSPLSKLLIVIDDVDKKMQLDALVPIHALNPNSLVIVTTRDESLLRRAGVTVSYEMKKMNPEHSRELFCWHAFQRQSCKSGFEKLVESFVKECGGLPLSLKVMGGHVYGSDKRYWKLQLDAVKASLHKDIKDTLKISYDALEEDQKQIFMDVACFFKGARVSRAVSIWKASGWRAEHALQTLKDKCLIEIRFNEHFWWSSPDTIDNYEPQYFLQMHDHLRDLGREMADNEMNHPRRLWRPEDLIGMQEFKGLKEILMRPEGKSIRCYGGIKGYESEDDKSYLELSYLLESSRTSTDLRWLKVEYTIPEWIPLQHLHTLILVGNSPWRLWQRDDQVPLKLKELHCFPRPYLTDSTQDKSMRDINELVSSFGMLKHLEILHLQFDSQVLEWDIEWNCLLKSVRELTNLKTLELLSFQLEGEFALGNSGETTDDRFCMGSLEAITLCRACKTRRVSIIGQSCPNLRSLKLYTMEDLIEVDVSGVSTLECLVLLKCRQLRKVLANGLPNLEMFRMKQCQTMTELPNFGRVSCLNRICISHCRKLQDISAIERLKGLKRIWIAYCPELKNIKAIEQLKGLKRFLINECTNLQGVICFKELKALKSVFIAHCPRLQNILGIECLKCLESIVITACPQLQHIRGIEELKGLKEMIIADSPIISCVERLQTLPGELTIIAGRSAMPDLIAEDGLKWTSFMSDLIVDKIGGALSTADGFCEIDGQALGHVYASGGGIIEHTKEMIHSFNKTQHSVSTFIFCAMYERSPEMPSGRSYVNISKGAAYLGPKLGSPAGRQRMTYTYLCVVNGGRLSNYDFWMPSNWCVEKAFLISVKEGEEKKILHILQSLLVAQPCVGISEDYDAGDVYYNDNGWGVPFDDFPDEYDDEDEDYDGGDED